MANYQVAYNPASKVAKIQPQGAAAGAGFTVKGTFHHEDNDDTLGKPAAHNHVFYHHVRDIMYKNGVLDMHAVKITMPVAQISVPDVAKTLDLSNAETYQIYPSTVPADAPDVTYTYASSDATKATVSNRGLVTPVAVGTTNITVTASGGATKVVAITVQA
jgi:hypothetical protein